MKIVFISDACLPSPSAEALFVVRMAQALSEHGHEVILLVPGGKHDRHTDTQAIAAYYGIIPAFTTQPVAWPGGAKAIRLWAWRSARAAQHWAPDLVYARHIAAGWAALEAGLPCIVELHQGIQGRPGRTGPAIDYLDDRLRQAAGRWQAMLSNRHAPAEGNDRRALASRGGYVQNITLLRRLAAYPNLVRVVVITHALARDLCEAAPRLASRILVAPDGALLPTRPPGPAPFERGKTLCVGYCGHLYAGKGVEIIEAIARRCPWAQFHVLGGLTADRERWRARTADCSNLVFHDHVEPHRVGDWLAVFDVCLLPNQPTVATYQASRRGDTGTNIGAYTSPMKMFEYMAAGKPIVASDLAVLREILVHDTNALLCGHDDVSAWAAALSRLAEDATLCQRLATAARTDLEAHYTWSARARRVVADPATTQRTTSPERS